MIFFIFVTTNITEYAMKEAYAVINANAKNKQEDWQPFSAMTLLTSRKAPGLFYEPRTNIV